eukprot:1915511-Rhodomonas_salina.1
MRGTELAYGATRYLSDMYNVFDVFIVVVGYRPPKLLTAAKSNAIRRRPRTVCTRLTFDFASCVSAYALSGTQLC